MLRQFGDELVVRNAATGNTHLLHALSAEVLRLLVESAEGVTAAELAAKVGEADERAGWIAAMEDQLSEFKRLGLAEPLD